MVGIYSRQSLLPIALNNHRGMFQGWHPEQIRRREEKISDTTIVFFVKYDVFVRVDDTLKRPLSIFLLSGIDRKKGLLPIGRFSPDKYFSADSFVRSSLTRLSNLVLIRTVIDGYRIVLLRKIFKSLGRWIIRNNPTCS